MSDYDVVNGLTRPHASEQDKLIASVELAGYRLVRVETRYTVRYMVMAPDGGIVGAKTTRYSAALLAEEHIWWGIK
jgi:hypothetical protein